MLIATMGSPMPSRIIAAAQAVSIVISCPAVGLDFFGGTAGSRSPVSDA